MLSSRARLTSVWMPDLKGTVLQAVVRRLPVLVELCAVQRVDSCNCGNNPPCSASEQASAWKLQCRACAFAQRLLASLGESGLEPGHFASSSSPFRADFLLIKLRHVQITNKIVPVAAASRPSPHCTVNSRHAVRARLTGLEVARHQSLSQCQVVAHPHAVASVV